MNKPSKNRLGPLPAFLTAVPVVLAVLAILPSPAWSRPQQAAVHSSPAQSADRFALDQKIPVDPKITVGELPNGLRYYIRENREPKNRADLRLVVNAGSVLEDEDQRGLAHMVEHTAFNGSKHFARQKLVEFMESIGMRFGADLNAFTGFDETIYTLRIPTDSPEIIRTALLILEDWAHGLTFDEKAIDKERGVITEEWRLGQGAEARMRDKQFPVLFRGSRYAERQPIGKKEIIETFKPETLKRFYRTWYRPDLMAVIAVGDFDRAKMEELVKRQFAAIPRDPKAPPRPVYPVPDHDETLVAVATDKEETRSTVAVFHKLPLRDQSTVGAYRQRTVEMLFNAMLNNRFNEIAQKPDPPFLGAGSSEERFVASKEVFALSALVPEGGIVRGLRALYTEGERVARFGFTKTEFERQKQDIARFYERALVQKETEDSGDFAEEFTRSFLEGEPIPGIEYEHTLQSHFLPEIALDEVNRLAREWMTARNRVIMVNAPDKPGPKVPDAPELLAVLEDIKHLEIAPYQDTLSEAPLLAVLPPAGEVVSSRAVEAAGITEWTLSNGARVVLKPTKFKEDEILVRATSPGGISLAAEENLVPANTADNVVASGGLDGFSEVDLHKKLAGKAVTLTPLIGELEEGLSGSASPKDAETLFQMIYLTFTSPRPDPTVFESIKAQLKAALENRVKDPEAVFTDTLRSTLQRDQPRFRAMTVDDIPHMDLEKSLAFYRDRFADADDFAFIFVGNLDLEKLKPLVCRYLASLPTHGRKETWKDWRVPPPEGVVKRSVVKGVEPKSLEAIVFSGPFRSGMANRLALRAAAQVLETRLRKVLREKLGETYDVSVRPYMSKIPREEYRLMIDLGADPKRIDSMTKVIFKEIKELKDKGPDDHELSDVRTAESRDYETNCRENGWWLAELVERYRVGEDPAEVLRFPETLSRLTKRVIQDAARMYLNTKRYVQVTLYPEKMPAAPRR
jgi:zinc protease